MTVMSGLRKRLTPLVALGALLAPVAVTVAASPAQATGNNGTIKVHAEGSPPGTEDNEPKVCAFNLEFFGFDEGTDGYVTFDVQGGDGPTGVAAGPFEEGTANADGYFESEYFNVEGGPVIQNGHYKVTLYGKFNDGRPNYEDIKAKSKVFKVDCQPTEPEGSNNSSSPGCEQITVGEPTGVKPEGATVVIKLDGQVTQPGTYSATPGEHVVTTYINGTLVDTDKIMVQDCPPPVVTCPEGTIPTDTDGDGVIEPGECGPSTPPVVVPPVVTPPVVNPPVVTPPVVNPPVKRDNPKASVNASCVTAHYGEARVRLNNKRSDVRNSFRIVKPGRDRIVKVRAGAKKVINLTGLRVGSIIKVKSGGKLLAKTRVPRGCQPTPVPNTGFRQAASGT